MKHNKIHKFCPLVLEHTGSWMGLGNKLDRCKNLTDTAVQTLY